MRKPILETFPPLPEIRQGEEIRVHETYQFELTTPMIGGDSESWGLNEKNPVRAPSIKGQLRFWWRTMQSEADPKKLLDKENRLWGGPIHDDQGNVVYTQSPVKISVFNQSGNKIALSNDLIPDYITFPIRQTKSIKEDERECINSLTFDMLVSMENSTKMLSDDDQKAVRNTITLWVLFGGVGARTRRGCGSIWCSKLMAQFKSAEDLVAFIQSVSNGKDILEYPRLGGSLFAYKRFKSQKPSKAWSKLISNYTDFRQDRNGKFGRTFWPEADAIRRLTGKKKNMNSPPHPDGIWFPRAAYGLPILSKFITKGGDPGGVIKLHPFDEKGKELNRWPSPVILKVIKLGNGDVLQVALILNQKFPKSLKLIWEGAEEPVQIDNSEATRELVSKGKVLRTGGKGPINPGESLYQVLFRGLGLEEVK